MNNFTEIIKKSMEYDKYIHEHRQNVFKALKMLIANYNFIDFKPGEHRAVSALILRV